MQFKKGISKHSLDQPSIISDHIALAGHSKNNLEFNPLELINSHRDIIGKASREANYHFQRKDT